jgi:uncharacterized protein (DUF433 family)
MITVDTDYHDRVVIDPAILSGKPIIAGTRIPVSLILNLLAHGYGFERIVEAYPNLSDDDIRAALAYAQARMDREEVLPLAGRA